MAFATVSNWVGLARLLQKILNQWALDQNRAVSNKTGCPIIEQIVLKSSTTILLSRCVWILVFSKMNAGLSFGCNSCSEAHTSISGKKVEECFPRNPLPLPALLKSWHSHLATTSHCLPLWAPTFSKLSLSTSLMFCGYTNACWNAVLGSNDGNLSFKVIILVAASFLAAGWMSL